MILGELWKLHDDATIARLDAAAMSLLNKGGARVENETLLNLAETSGCRIDRSAMRCYFSDPGHRDRRPCRGG
jgi:hypothetical protein